LHIVVCVKQVPDTSEVKVDPIKGTLVRAGVPSIANPYDMHALEEALRIKDKYGATITILSMGPNQATDVIKRSISLGADNGVLLSDRAFAGSDTLATSYILAQAVRKIAEKEPVDMVFCGKMAIDGDTAQVGPGIASRLDFAVATYVVGVRSVDTEKKRIVVERRLERGVEVVECRMPVLLTVNLEANDIRYAALPALIDSIKYEVPVWTVEDFDLDLTQCGLKGSPTQVKKIFPPIAKEVDTVMVTDTTTNPAEIAKILADKIEEAGLLA
jgi:electron transfer flavoprotein beta subunit